MSAIADVVNGQIVNNPTNVNTDIAKAEKASKKQAGGTLDKDAFLRLLVAQMKYQDPLEPTENTEYVSQLATFSELEEMQNMVKSSDMQRASVLVGQYVSIAQDDSSGNTKYTEGFVDGVVYQANKTYLKIADVLYDFENLDQVFDNNYVIGKRIEEMMSSDDEGTKEDADEEELQNV